MLRPPFLLSSVGAAPRWAHSLLLASLLRAPPLATYSTAAGGGGREVQLSRGGARLDRQPGHLEGREAATVDDGT